MDQQVLWQLTDISKIGFKAKRLDSIYCQFTQGITAIIGESGAGKSTLINLLSRMELPDSGEINCNIKQEACPFYIVPQDFGLWAHMTAIKHIEQVIPKDHSIDASALLKKFDLEHKAHEYPEFLSQGECSRLSLARAIATDSKVLIMDEPLANVDRGRKDKYWNFLLKHLQSLSGSLIFSTHDSSEALAYSNKVVCMQKGQILASGQTINIYQNPKTPEISKLLGPGTWLKENPFEIQPGFYRPEAITLQESESDFSINQTRFFGTFNKSEISNDSESFKIFHSASDKVANGMKVILALLMIFLVSCSEQQSTLSFKEITSWNIPSAGQRLPGPRAITCGQNGEVIVLDDAGRVLVYDSQGELKRKWKMPETELGHPEGVTVFNDGKIAVADTHYARVVVFNPDGTVAYKFGSRGDQPGQFYSPVGISLDKEQNIYICEYGFNDRVQKFSKEGKFIVSFGKSGVEPGNMQRASDMVWTDGKLYVADAVNNRIQVFSDDGKFLHILKNQGAEIPFYLPYDIDQDPNGYLWTVEYANCRLTKTTISGEVLGYFGKAGTELNCFNNPWGLGIDQEGTIYVADTANRRVVVLRN
ncbi:MAG: ATP-binding cassette domain-containing protein [Lentisphaerales bacterium]|nr:ATP-binding cassette domain-containing protein [Lentisphaerales bacterium]